MQASAEFRLLTEQSDVLNEIAIVVYRDVEQFGKVCVVCSDKTILDQLSDYFWQNAKQNFVTYQCIDEAISPRVNVLLTQEIRFAKSSPALCNINYLLAPSDLRFKRITEIVLPASETVDKARRQYKMYRSAGLEVSHTQR